MGKDTFVSGDVKILSFNLTTLDDQKPIPLLEQAQVIDIYESILSPIVTGSIDIVDKIKIRESYPIIGGKCKIKLQFQTPGSPVPRVLEMIVTDVSNVVTEPNAAGSRYTLNLASIEILENAKAYFRAPLIGNTIEDYVNMIVKNVLNSKKQIFMEPNGTKGQQRMDVVSMKPFQAIDMLKQNAVSKTYKSNVYVFFENKLGFNFAPIEYLLSAKQKLIQDGIFFYDTDVKTNAKNTTFRNILAYNHIVQESPAKLINDGALKNKTNQIDLRTRTKQTVEYDYAKAKDEFQYSKGARPIHKASFEEEYGKLPALTYNIAKNSVMPESYLPEKMGYAKAFVSMLTQNILRIMVWGDTYLSAGYRVRTEIPSPSGLTKTGGTQKTNNSDFVSGEFLISHLRHNLSKVNANYRHFTSMELVNVAYGKSGAFDS